MRKVIITSLAIIIFILPNFSFGQNSEREVSIVIFEEISHSLKISWQKATIFLQETGDWIVNFWDSYIFPWLKNLWEKIKSPFQKEIEKRKTALPEEFEKEKQEIREEFKEEASKIGESFWEKIKKSISDIFRFD